MAEISEIEAKQSEIQKELNNISDSKTQGQITKLISDAYKKMETNRDELYKAFKEENKDNKFILETNAPISLRPEDKKAFEKYVADSPEVKKERDEVIENVAKVQKARDDKIKEIGGKRDEKTGEYTGGKINDFKKLLNDEIETRNNEITKAEEEKNLNEQQIEGLNQQIAQKENELANAKPEEKESIEQELASLRAEKGQLESKNAELATTIQTKKDEVTKIETEFLGKVDQNLQKPLQQAIKTHSQVREQSYNALVNTFGEENITKGQAENILGNKNEQALEDREKRQKEQQEKNEKAKEENEPEEIEQRDTQSEELKDAINPNMQARAMAGGMAAGAVPQGGAAVANNAVPQQQVEQQSVEEMSQPNINEDFEHNMAWIGYDATKPLTKSSARALLRNFVDNPDKQMSILMDPKGQDVIRNAMEMAGKTKNPIANLRFNKTRKALLNLGENTLADEAVRKFEALNGHQLYRTQKGNEFNEIASRYDQELKEIEAALQNEAITPEEKAELSAKFNELEKKYAPIIGVLDFKDAADKNMAKNRVKFGQRIRGMFSNNKKLEEAKDKTQEEKTKEDDRELVGGEQMGIDEYMNQKDEKKDPNIELRENIEKMTPEEFKEMVEQAIANDDKEKLALFNSGEIELPDDKFEIFENSLKEQNTKQNVPENSFRDEINNMTNDQLRRTVQRAKDHGDQEKLKKIEELELSDEQKNVIKEAKEGKSFEERLTDVENKMDAKNQKALEEDAKKENSRFNKMKNDIKDGNFLGALKEGCGFEAGAQNQANREEYDDNPEKYKEDKEKLAKIESEMRDLTPEERKLKERIGEYDLKKAGESKNNPEKDGNEMTK